MSTEVSANVLKNFIVNNLGIRTLNQAQAQKHGVDEEDFTRVAEDEVTIDVTDILGDTDLYEHFASMYIDDKEQKAEADEEREKREAAKVQDKGESKA